MWHLIWVYIVCSGLSIQIFWVNKVYKLLTLEYKTWNWDTLSTYHTCPKIWNNLFYYLSMCLKYCCMYGKQCRPWSYAAFCGIWSGSTVFENACLSQYLWLLRQIEIKDFLFYYYYYFLYQKLWHAHPQAILMSTTKYVEIWCKNYRTYISNLCNRHQNQWSHVSG